MNAKFDKEPWRFRCSIVFSHIDKEITPAYVVNVRPAIKRRSADEALVP